VKYAAKLFFVINIITIFLVPCLHAQDLSDEMLLETEKLAAYILEPHRDNNVKLDEQSYHKTLTEEINVLDAIIRNEHDVVHDRLSAQYLSESPIYIPLKSYVAVMGMSEVEAMKHDRYEQLLSLTDHSNWYIAHVSSFLLSFVHSRGENPIEGLKYAELSLKVIPVENNWFHNQARYNSYYAINTSFVIDGDLTGVLGASNELITLARQTNRKLGKYSIVNNLAVVLDKNGETKAATKITKLMIQNAGQETPYNKFVANLSHGRFLLKVGKPQEAINYLKEAIMLSPQDEYKAFLLVDLANAQAKSRVFTDAKRSLREYEEYAKRTSNANQYASRNLDETKALIAASQKDYEAAFKHQKQYSQVQINFFKDGLSTDRREANRRVLLTEEIAKKNLEKAELQSKLAEETLAKQKAKGRLYVALIAIGFVLTVGSGAFTRRLSKLNKKLKKANEEIVEKSKVKTDLLAMFSHEMLTPLNGIVPLADVLQRGETDQKKKKLLKMIEMSGTELTRKMKDIVLVANPYGQSTNPISVDVERFLYESLSQFHDHTPEGVDLTVQMGKDLPQYLKFDVERVRAAVSALLSNSLKYTDRGRVVLSLYLNEAGRTVIDVMDTGTGIDPARLDDMSKPFGQESLSITRENQGLGLGLTIVRLQCLIMGADFQMESQLGLGTSIRIILPENTADKTQVSPLQDAA